MKKQAPFNICKACGFSLIELIVALSVLALIFAIIIPKFLGIQEQAKDVISKQIANELNHVYANWAASGGITGSGPFLTSDWLKVFSSPTSTNAGSGTGLIQDAGDSSNVRATGLDSFVTVPSLMGGAADGSMVQIGDTIVWFDNSDKTFKTYGQTQLQNMPWTPTQPPGNEITTMSPVVFAGRSFNIGLDLANGQNSGPSSDPFANLYWTHSLSPNTSQDYIGTYGGQLYKISLVTSAPYTIGAVTWYNSTFIISKPPAGINASQYPPFPSSPGAPGNFKMN